LRRPTGFWRRHICPSTIGGFGVARPSPRTIIERPRGRWSWRKFFIWKAGESWATTGGCGTTTARHYAPAKGKVTVCEWEDGRLQIRYRGRGVVWEEIPGPVPVQVVRPREATAKKQKPPTPQVDPPWRQDYRKMRPWSKPGTLPGSLIHEMSG